MENNEKPENIIFGELKGGLGHKDTLTNCCQILEMLEYLDLSEGLAINAQFGIFLTLENVIDALRFVSVNLKN